MLPLTIATLTIDSYQVLLYEGETHTIGKADCSADAMVNTALFFARHGLASGKGGKSD